MLRSERSLWNKLRILRRSLSCWFRTLHTDLLVSGLIWFASQPRMDYGQTAIVFSPHQDDETLGCGGLIALKRAAGVDVRVVFLTDGGKSPSSLPREALVVLRRQEAIKALALLGVPPDHIDFLDYPDGTLRSLEAGQYQSLLHEISRLIAQHRPQEVYVPHRQDRHYFGDHEATRDLVRAAIHESGSEITLWQYPVWILWQPFFLIDLKPKELAGAVHLEISKVLARKLSAIAVYQSQIFPTGFLKRFASPYEIFFKDTTSQDRESR
jgi:N-acetylglucosamine malate deacetylase 1